MNLSQKDMHPTGASGITTRFQELFRCMGQVGHALLTRSPLSRPEQAPADPVRLACVKHAASVHPEPESNPPQKTSRRESTCDSQNKENRLRLIRKGAIARKPRRPSRPLGHSPTGSGRRTGNH